MKWIVNIFERGENMNLYAWRFKFGLRWSCFAAAAPVALFPPVAFFSFPAYVLFWIDVLFAIL